MRPGIGLLAPDGHITWLPRELETGYLRAFSEGRAAIMVHEKWGYVDKEGLLRIAPRFLMAKDFSEGLAGVMLGGSTHFDTPGPMPLIDQYTLRCSVSERRAHPTNA